jgi:hypothetical protein
MNIFNNKYSVLIDILLILILIISIICICNINIETYKASEINGVLFNYEEYFNNNENSSGLNNNNSNENSSGLNNNNSNENSSGLNNNNNSNENSSGLNNNNNSNENSSGLNNNNNNSNENSSGLNNNSNENGSRLNNNNSNENSSGLNLTLGFIDFNTLFNLGNKMNEINIRDNVGEVIITRDPNISKYSDTYSMTPYATYLLGPLSELDGDDINFVESRYNNCIGKWIDLDKDEKCRKNADSENPHDFPERHRKTIWENPCDVYSRQYIIYNPEYIGEDCKDENGNKINNGDIEYVTCNYNDEYICGSNDNSTGHCDSSDSSICRCYNGFSGDNCEHSNQIT